MSELAKTIGEICQACGNDRTRMMDIVREVQQKNGCVSSEAMDLIAKEVGTHRVEVESVVSFYAFLSDKQKGNVVVRLCNDVIDKMNGYNEVAKALSAEFGVGFGETTSDGKITLDHTPCIGMCDQAPAAMVNDVVVTNLNAETAKAMASELKQHLVPSQLVKTCGDGNNSNDLVKAMVNNNIMKKGSVIFGNKITPGVGLKKALGMSPEDLIQNIKDSNLRGRGGAGFPTGMKWDFTRKAQGDKKYVLCNADEGEPGTFKDRVLLTEAPELTFEGMAIAGYAIGSDEGVVYLRGEYAYLRAFLENVLNDMRNKNLLGKDVCGKAGFNFDIRIQMGAGAYVCGEESALISSCEGLRGDPKNRPPFPAEKGYNALPTTVNNVETFSCVTRILENNADWFKQQGNENSAGTKLLSICGDCAKPGIYEVPFGTTLNEVIEMSGAQNVQAIQVGGPSGSMVGQGDFGRCICFNDLATGGSIMIFNKDRDVLEVAKEFMEFFNEENCGFCTPCRVGNTLLQEGLERVLNGKGTPNDLTYLEDLGVTVKLASRCGLGQTSANPILTTLQNFRGEYEKRVKESGEALLPTFDLKEAVSVSEGIIGRKSVHF